MSLADPLLLFGVRATHINVVVEINEEGDAAAGYAADSPEVDATAIAYYLMTKKL